jgi:sugar phosphate isomerase/epimerase
MKIGILLGSLLRNMSMDEAIRCAADLGFECIEIPAYEIGKEEEQYDLKGAERIVDIAEKLGLTVSSFQCHVGYSQPDWRIRVEHTKKMIDIAYHTGVNIVHTVSGILPSLAPIQWKRWLKGTADIANTPEWNRILEAYREICDYARDKNVKVAIEPVFVYMVCNYETTKKLFDDLGREDLYINFDPSHFPYQREDPIPFIKDFGNKIIHCHAKDGIIEKENPAEIEAGQAFSMGEGEQFKFAAPGKGVLDWEKIIKALGEVGYDYVLSLEIEWEGIPVDEARECLRFFQNLLSERR